VCPAGLDSWAGTSGGFTHVLSHAGSFVWGIAEFAVAWNTSGGWSSPAAMQLSLSDPSYTERLVSFFASLGRALRTAEPGRLVLEEELADLELAMYLRVWHVLHPEAVVSVELEI
jgi:hypothetical protein